MNIYRFSVYRFIVFNSEVGLTENGIRPTTVLFIDLNINAVYQIYLVIDYLECIRRGATICLGSCEIDLCFSWH